MDLDGAQIHPCLSNRYEGDWELYIIAQGQMDMKFKQSLPFSLTTAGRRITYEIAKRLQIGNGKESTNVFAG